jgi:hypothetical protein
MTDVRGKGHRVVTAWVVTEIIQTEQKCNR